MYSSTFHLAKVKGQWRIDQPPNGLLVGSDQFQAAFRQYAVYYYDSQGQDLAPAPRYTQLVDPADVVPWLVQGLAVQPPSGLSSALPQNGSDSIRATYPADPTQPITVEIPGAGGLNRANLDRLAGAAGRDPAPGAAGRPDRDHRRRQAGPHPGGAHDGVLRRLVRRPVPARPAEQSAVLRTHGRGVPGGRPAHPRQGGPGRVRPDLGGADDRPRLGRAAGGGRARPDQGRDPRHPEPEGAGHARPDHGARPAVASQLGTGPARGVDRRRGQPETGDRAQGGAERSR